jgi:predicted amidohydrolase
MLFHISTVFVCLLILALAFASSARAQVAGDPPADRLVIALLQMEPDGNNLMSNAAKAVAFCRQAAEQGADIALMPEMWSIGYTRFDADKPGAREAFYENAVATDSAYIRQFAELAAELDMAIGVAYMQAYEPLPRNAITLFDRHGNEVYTYAKVHTSDFKPMEASMTAGHDFYVGELDTRLGPVMAGSMICFDRELPESARILMLKGAELILTPNACKLDDNRIDQFKVRAFENLVITAMANYPGDSFLGRSVAFDAGGKCLVEAGKEEGIYLASCDLEDLRARRAKSIWGGAYRRPHRYGLLVSPEKAPVWDRIDGNGEPYNPLVR